MAVVIGLFLATMCVIKRVSRLQHVLNLYMLTSGVVCPQRDEEERFKKIDAKRGGRGFV